MAIETLTGNTYPGRGIIIGKSACSRYAVIAYFIMGRSENSRNRRFVKDGDGIRTEAVDPAKLSDPSLIIYWPVRVDGSRTIVTNGDQTDTVYEYVREGKSFTEALATREYEPDAPNYTPRISGMVTLDGAGGFSYELDVMRNATGQPGGVCVHDYTKIDVPERGKGHLIHTYLGDGNPIPSFNIPPVEVEIKGGTEDLAKKIWAELDEDNKVSLYVRRTNIKTGEYQEKIINKYK